MREVIMPVAYLRNLTSYQSNQREDNKAIHHLAAYLAFVAGAINAGGLLAVQQYTSHMSGLMSSIADNLVLGKAELILDGAGAILSFIGGAAATAILVNWARRRNLQSQYALPLVMEALLLICFGWLGASMQQHHWLFIPVTVSVLCFVMGLQNAMITKISRAEIRTTHVTGMVTDIGIELGKLFYWNGREGQLDHPPVLANRAKIKQLFLLVGMFMLGGLAGALGFKYIGYISTVPLVTLLITLAGVPILDDLGITVRKNA